MSIEAMVWALKDAPSVPPQCVSVLIGLAEHADKHGRGAFVGQAALARYARKSDRQVRKDLALLLSRGTIRLGDQALVAHIVADARPVVYDLAMPRNSSSARNRSSGRSASAKRAVTPSDQQELISSGTAVPGGTEIPAGTTGVFGRNCSSDEPSNEPKNSSAKSSTGKPPKHEVADELAEKFWDVHKSSTAQPFLAIRGIIRTAIGNGLPRNDVARALDQLAKQQVAISGGGITNAVGRLHGRGQQNGQSKYAPGSRPTDPLPDNWDDVEVRL